MIFFADVVFDASKTSIAFDKKLYPFAQFKFTIANHDHSNRV
jgi:hypothetical protein